MNMSTLKDSKLSLVSSDDDKAVVPSLKKTIHVESIKVLIEEATEIVLHFFPQWTEKDLSFLECTDG